jgi:DNA-binding IclR family transcriptional regulator
MRPARGRRSSASGTQTSRSPRRARNTSATHHVTSSLSREAPEKEHKRLEQEINTARERKGSYDPGELERRLEEWANAHRPDTDKFEAGLRISGRGEYDLDTEKGRREYLSARLTPEDDTPETVESLSLDASKEEQKEYFAARLDGATVEGEGTSE